MTSFEEYLFGAILMNVLVLLVVQEFPKLKTWSRWSLSFFLSLFIIVLGKVQA